MVFVHRDLTRLPRFNKAVITIGTFDGVHTGHQLIIEQLQKEAEAIGGETVIITFHPHPRKIVSGGNIEVKLLNTLDEKIELLHARGITHVVVVPFDEKFANQGAEAYVKDFLVDTFHPHTIIIGYDHRFGKNRVGDYHLLEALAPVHGFKLMEIPEHVLNNIIVSSTRIRNAIANCDMQGANSNLGYTYFFEGKVIHGNKLGRTLGYPTANLQPQDDDKLLPAHGIYAVHARIEGSDELHQGMMSIGVRPTIGGTDRVIEVNLFNFDRDVYGRHIRVYVNHFLRPEVKFENLEQLTQQLHKDKTDSLNWLNKT